MTLFDVDVLGRYWRRHPPVHLLVAGFVGYKPDAITTPAEQPGSSMPIQVTLATLPGLSAATVDDLPAPVFDIAELMAMRPS